MVKGPGLGRHVRALLSLMRRGTRRATPRPDIAALLDRELPADLRALLEVWAHHDPGFVSLGELWIEDQGFALAMPKPDMRDDRDDVIVIGNSPGGDLYAIEQWPRGDRYEIHRVIHDDGWRLTPSGHGLEDFLQRLLEEDGVNEPEFTAALAAIDREDLRDDPDAYERARAAGRAAAKAGRLAAIPERALPARAEPPPPAWMSRYPAHALRLPGTPRSAVFAHDDAGIEHVYLVDAKGKAEEVKLPARKAWRALASMSPDGACLYVGSGTFVRRVSTATGAIFELLMGAGYADSAQLAGGLGVVRSAGGEHRLDMSDPDVQALAEARRFPRGHATITLGVEGALWLLDSTATDDDKIIVQGISVDPSAMWSALAGRVLVLCRQHADGWQTAVLGVVGRKPVLLGKLRDHVGAPFAHDGKLYGANGYELLGVEAALAAAAGADAITSIDDDLDGGADGSREAPAAVKIDERVQIGDGPLGLTLVPNPATPDAPCGISRMLIAPPGWMFPTVRGKYSVAAAAVDGKRLSAQVVYDYSAKLIPVTPPIVDKELHAALSPDGKRSVFLARPSHKVYEVTNKTGAAKRIATGTSKILWFAIAGDAIALLVDRAGKRRLELRRGGKVIASLDARGHTGLQAVCDGKILILAAKQATQFLAFDGTKLRPLGTWRGRITASWPIEDMWFVLDAEGRTHEVTGWKAALKRSKR